VCREAGVDEGATVEFDEVDLVVGALQCARILEGSLEELFLIADVQDGARGELEVVVVVGDATARLPPSATIDETMRAAATNDPNIRLVEWFESACLLG